MGISRSLNELARKVEREARGLPRKVERIVRLITFEVVQVLVIGTPLDTGRARNNWVTSTGEPFLDADEGPGPFDKSGGFAIAQARDVLSRYRIDAGAVYVASALSYIVPLERGHSSQAPKGMVRMAVQAGISVARRERVRILLVRS